MLLSDMLNENLIKVPLTARTRDEAITEMAGLVQGHVKRISDRDELIRRIKHRENIQSTGVGGGLALMHALMDNTDHRVYTAMGIARPGIEFNALDNKPVDILFLLVCQNGLDVIYLQTLSTIARLFRDKQLCASARAAVDAGDLIARLRSFESGMS